MKNQNLSSIFINAYLVAGIVHIFMMVSGNDLLVTVSKYALMPLLWLYVISAIGFQKNIVWLSLAILFSWLGDIFLMYTMNNEIYFIAGLASFLIAHIFYILCFLQLVNTRIKSFKWKFALPLIIYGILLLVYLYSALGDMRLPVIVYAVVITLMGIAALHRLGKTSDYSFAFVFIGALLFIASDSMIAINKFQSPFNSAPFLIMVTYIAAQYLIVSGCVMHIKEKAPLS